MVLEACSSGSTVSPDGGGIDGGGPVGDAGTAVDAGGDARRDGSLGCGNYGVCNLVTNVGCDPAMGCYASVRGTTLTSACSVAGRRGWGEACAGTNGCREGFACIGSPAMCLKLCCGTDNTSCRDEARGGRPGAVCAGNITNTDMRYCIEVASCDPAAVTNNRCPTDRPRCDLVAIDGTTNCSAINTMSPGRDGSPCCFNNLCGVGLVCVPMTPGMAAACVPATPNRVCRRVCNPLLTGADAGAQCPMGQQCAIRFNDTPDTYGACTVAM